MVLLIQHIFQLKVFTLDKQWSGFQFKFNWRLHNNCLYRFSFNQNWKTAQRWIVQRNSAWLSLSGKAHDTLHLEKNTTWDFIRFLLHSGHLQRKRGGDVSLIWGYHLKLGSRHSELNNRSRNQSKFIHHIHWNLLYSLKSKFIKWKTKRTYPR